MQEEGVGWVLEAVAACCCLNLAGTLVASDLRSWEEEEEEERRKEKKEEKEEEEAAELVVGDSIPPTGAGRSSNCIHPHTSIHV